MEENIVKIYDSENIGEVKISEDVISVIAGLAATEVEGVHSMAGDITNDLVAKLGVKNLSKGVSVDITEGRITVNLSLIIKFGYTIPDVTARVQENVTSAIKNMTELDVEKVDINVTNVNMD